MDTGLEQAWSKTVKKEVRNHPVSVPSNYRGKEIYSDSATTSSVPRYMYI